MARNGGVLAPGSILEEDNPLAEEIEHAGETINLEKTDPRDVKRDAYVVHRASDHQRIPHPGSLLHCSGSYPAEG